MATSPLAGKPAPKELLVDVARLDRATHLPCALQRNMDPPLEAGEVRKNESGRK
jgi:hypothetical protein